jgi:hypothetical protein
MIRSIRDHVICAQLTRKDVDRLLIARATTARDLDALADDEPRIHFEDPTAPLFGLVLSVGRGRVHPSTGLFEETTVRAGDIVLLKQSAPRLGLPYLAKEVVGSALALDDCVVNAKTFSVCEDSCEALVGSS